MYARRMNSILKRLTQIRRREQRATPGPWRWADWDKSPLDPGPPEPYTLEAPPETWPGWPGLLPKVGNRILTDGTREISHKDREFIAHARMDIPFLLELVARLKLELTKLQAERMLDDKRQEEVREPWE